MRILLWAGLSVLIAFQGNPELATSGIVLLTMAGRSTAGKPRYGGDVPWTAAPSG